VLTYTTSNNNWVVCKLGEMAEEIRELYEPTSAEQYPYIGLEHIGQRSLRLTGVGKSTETISTKKVFHAGDILFGSLRPYFRKVARPKFGGVCSTDITVIRAKAKADQGFLHYFIANQAFIDHATNISGGTRMPRANWKVLCDSKWSFPPLPTQRKIAAILSAYDDLIENNLRRIKILEEIAQNLYREWFVKFRFPGHEKARFVDSPLGKIPEGWEVVTLGGTCELRKDKFRKEEHGELPLLNLAKMLQRTLLVGEMGKPDELSTSRIIFEEDDILFGSIRPYLHKVVLAPCQGVTNVSVLVIRPRDEDLWSFLAVLLSSIDVIRWADQHSTGTKMPVIKWDSLQTMPVLMPSESVLHAFATAVEPLLQAIKMTFSRNQNLRRTRDLLLPKLISGDLDVSELHINLSPIYS